MVKRTVGDLLEEHLLALQNELKPYVNNSIFPEINPNYHHDLADIVFFISSLFVGVETDADYNAKVLELIELNGVTIIDKKNTDIVVKLLVDFVRYFKTL